MFVMITEHEANGVTLGCASACVLLPERWRTGAEKAKSADSLDRRKNEIPTRSAYPVHWIGCTTTRWATKADDKEDPGRSRRNSFNVTFRQSELWKFGPVCYGSSKTMVADLFVEVDLVHPQDTAYGFQLIHELRSFVRKRSSNCRHDDVCNVEDTRVERRRDDECFEQSGTSDVERFAEYGSHKRTPWENNHRTRNSTVAKRKG